MKKICFLIGNLDNSGGTERVTSLIANELAEKNVDVSILSLSGGTTPFFELKDSIHNYNLYPKHISFKKNFVGVVWKIRQFIKHNQIDTLIVVDSISCVFTVPAVYGLKVNHICWEHFNFNVNLGVKLRDLGRKLAAKYCDYIVTLTDRDKELWERGLEGINAKIVSIANPTPYENVEHLPNTKSKTILALGRLTYQKGFDILIEAWSHVCQESQDWKLRIVGGGEDEKALKDQANSLGISDRIDFIPVTRDVEHHYKTSAFFCLSSRFEGFGMVILEAQSFGLPVVSFDCDCGPTDLIENGINGWLVKNGDIDALAKQILECIDIDNESYIETSRNASKSSSKFSAHHISKKWSVII